MFQRLLLLLLTAIWMVFVINRLVDLEVTTGEWIEIVITSLALIIAFTIWAHYAWYRPHIHYRLLFPEGNMLWPPNDAESQDYSRKLVGGSGTLQIRFAVRTSASAKFSRIDVRFISRRYFRFRRPRPWLGWWRFLPPFRLELWHWINARDKNQINLVALKEVGKRNGFDVSPPDTEDNVAGGRRMFFTNPQQVLAYEFMWFEATVVVPNGWKGFMSFEAAMADGRKARSRRKVHFGYTPAASLPPSPNTEAAGRE